MASVLTYTSNYISCTISSVLGELDTVGWQKVKVIRCCQSKKYGYDIGVDGG